MSVTAASPKISPGGDEAVLEVYDRAASRYDLVNDLVSFGTSNWYRRRTVLSLELPEDATLVDVGSGTGALALAAQRFLPDSPAIVAVDPSTEMRGLAVKAGGPRRSTRFVRVDPRRRSFDGCGGERVRDPVRRGSVDRLRGDPSGAASGRTARAPGDDRSSPGISTHARSIPDPGRRFTGPPRDLPITSGG